MLHAIENTEKLSVYKWLKIMITLCHYYTSIKKNIIAIYKDKRSSSKIIK